VKIISTEDKSKFLKKTFGPRKKKSNMMIEILFNDYISRLFTKYFEALKPEGRSM
jgi:hypothetical protein